MPELEESLTEAARLLMFKRLSRHLQLPGRLDEAIFMLQVEANNLYGPNAASATQARAICEQLQLRIPPELLRLIRLLEQWEEGQPPPIQPLPPIHLDLFRPGKAETVAILGPQIVIGLIIANTSIAAIEIYNGRGLTEVIMLWVVLTALTLVSVFCCMKLSAAPRSIPEAQFIHQAYQGRKEYEAKGLLTRPVGGLTS